MASYQCPILFHLHNKTPNVRDVLLVLPILKVHDFYLQLQGVRGCMCIYVILGVFFKRARIYKHTNMKVKENEYKQGSICVTK
jgi:hypothetical protein